MKPELNLGSLQDEKSEFFQLTIAAGGRGGIRTHGTLAGTPVFKTGALNHSATLPSLRDQALSVSSSRTQCERGPIGAETLNFLKILWRVFSFSVMRISRHQGQSSGSRAWSFGGLKWIPNFFVCSNARSIRTVFFSSLRSVSSIGLTAINPFRCAVASNAPNTAALGYFWLPANVPNCWKLLANSLWSRLRSSSSALSLSLARTHAKKSTTLSGLVR